MKSYLDIPVPQWKPQQDGVIPESVTELKSEKEPEDEFFVLSYYYYNEKECEISSLEGKRGKATLEALKTIGRSTNKSLQNNHIDRFRVFAGGDYKYLFKKLPEDFDDLYEHKIQGESRLFYHIADNKFYIICIKNNHIPVGKHK